MMFTRRLVHDMTVIDNEIVCKKGRVQKRVDLEEIVMSKHGKVNLRDNLFMFDIDTINKISDGIIGIVNCETYYGDEDEELYENQPCIIYKSSAKKVRQRAINSTFYPKECLTDFRTGINKDTQSSDYINVEYYDYWANDAIYLFVDGDVYITTLSEFINRLSEEPNYVETFIPYPQLNIYNHVMELNLSWFSSQYNKLSIACKRICIGGSFQDLPDDDCIENVLKYCSHYVSALQSSPNNLDLELVSELRWPTLRGHDIFGTSDRAYYYHLGMIALGKSQAHIKTKEEARAYYSHVVCPPKKDYKDWEKECLVSQVKNSGKKGLELITKIEKSGRGNYNNSSLGLLFHHNIIDFIIEK